MRRVIFACLVSALVSTSASAGKGRTLFDKAHARNFALTLTHANMRGANTVSLSVAKPRSGNYYGHTYLQISKAQAAKIIDYLNESTWPVSPNSGGVRFVDDGSFIVAAQSEARLLVVDLRWGTKTLRWVKGLADTLRGPAAEAVGKMTVALERYVSGVAQAEALAKAEPVKRDLKKFALNLRWRSRYGLLGRSKPFFHNLTLTVGKPPKARKLTLSAQITEVQAGEIIDHLRKGGFHHRAVRIGPLPDRALLRPPMGPAYTLTVRHGQGWGFDSNLGWGPRMLDRLDALRKALPRGSDAAKAMDELLVSLTPDRKRWKAESAMKPAPLAAHRAALLKEHSAAFFFSLACLIGPEKADRSSLMLSVLGFGKVKLPKRTYRAQITKPQAARIIDHMVAQGYLARAVCIPPRSELPWNGPVFAVSASHPDGYALTAASSWTPVVLQRRLDALRKVLDGEAAKAMDKLLKGLEPQRERWEKWEKEAVATKPAHAAKAVRFKTAKDAIAFITECVEKKNSSRLTAACVGDRPKAGTYLDALVRLHAATPLPQLYAGKTFPKEKAKFALGGHGSKWRHIRIEFVRKEDGWALADISVCR